MAAERGSESASSLKFVVDKVSFVNKLPMLSKATLDDAQPTAGYMYQQICNITTDNSSYCSDLLDYLVGRLEKNSYHVKLKVLRIMRFVVDNGHKDFRQGLRRNAHGIRDATKYGGPPDPLHGNAPYIMVRQEAKELCQSLFDVLQDEQESELSADSMSMAPMVGIGSGSSKGNLQGFGNVSSRQKSLGESIVGGIRDLAEKVIDSSPTPSHSVTTSDSCHEKPFTSYKPVDFGGKDETVPHIRTDRPGSKDNGTQPVQHRIRSTPRGPSKRVHRPGVAGGGWEDSDEDTPSPSDSSKISEEDSSCRAFDGLKDQADSQEMYASITSLPKEDQFTAELHLVNGIINRDDELLKREDWETFVKSCPTLNCLKILEIIGDSLRSSSLKIQLHCLQLLEALLRTDYILPDDIAATCHTGLKLCCGSASGETKVKAKKVVLILEKLCSEGSPISDILHTGTVDTAMKYQHMSSSTTPTQSARTSISPDRHQDTKPDPEILMSSFSFIRVPFATGSEGS